MRALLRGAILAGSATLGFALPALTLHAGPATAVSGAAAGRARITLSVPALL